jgi:hypothetical protein
MAYSTVSITWSTTWSINRGQCDEGEERGRDAPMSCLEILMPTSRRVCGEWRTASTRDAGWMLESEVLLEAPDEAEELAGDDEDDDIIVRAE